MATAASEFSLTSCNSHDCTNLGLFRSTAIGTNFENNLAGTKVNPQPESAHWNFEAFRNFIGFAPIQQACTSLLSHNGISLDNADIELKHLNHLLLERTGREWTPDRNPGGNIIWETEGSLFRNKKRVFTGFYLLDAEKFEMNNSLWLTPFGQAIAAGHVSAGDFYKFIIRNFRYPHPAYEDNWEWWTSANRELRPLTFLLHIASNLSQMTGNLEAVKIWEVAYFGGPNPTTEDAYSVAEEIKLARETGSAINHERTDALDRKIGDMFAFLAMSPWATLRSKGLALNPIRRDSDDSPSIWLNIDDLAGQINQVTG